MRAFNYLLLVCVCLPVLADDDFEFPAPTSGHVSATTNEPSPEPPTKAELRERAEAIDLLKKHNQIVPRYTDEILKAAKDLRTELGIKPNETVGSTANAAEPYGIRETQP